MTRFKIDLSKTTDFPHYWEMCVGSCHAYTALRADYREQLKKAHNECGFGYVRFHGLFDDDMCVLTRKTDWFGNDLGLVYNFVNIDNIFDFLLEIGMKPFIELGFMPTALASGDKTVFHYKGNITPPADYDAWGAFIEKFAVHLVERYGLEEVRQWFFEVWNEPNLFAFFSGTKEDYFKLYESSVRAVKRVDAGLKVGGPATSCNSWITDTIEFCEKNAVPLDFISTHHYPTDDPLWRSGMDIIEFFKSGAAEKQEYKRGVLKEMTERVRSEAGDLPVYYTEWNTSAMTNDDSHDACYASAFVAKTIADNDGLVQCYSFWTFTDIFEEGSQLPGAFHGGFGLMTYAGIPKPVYRLFELYHGLGAERLSVTRTTNTNTEMLATKTPTGLRLAVYNHNIPSGLIKEETVEIELPVKPSSIDVYRIDDQHSNPRAEWEKMGKPEYLKRDDVQRLVKASELCKETISADGVITITLPPHGTAVIDVFMEADQ